MHFPVDVTDSAANRMFTWTFPGAPVQIRIEIDVIKQIEREISTTLNAGGPDQEIWGILLGRISTSIEIQAYKSMGPHWDAVRWERAHVECKARNDGLSVLGYYRTDRDHHIRLGDDDLALIHEYFPQQHSVFLVVDASGSGQSSKAGFFFWDRGKIHSAFSFLEFPFDAHELGLRAERQPKMAPAETPRLVSKTETPVPEEMRSRVVPKPAPSAFHNRHLAESSPSQEQLTQPAFPPWSRKATWTAAALSAAILAIAGGLYRWQHPANQGEHRDAGASPSGLLALRVNRSGSDFEVSWDRASSAVRRASNGTLTIRDGGFSRILQLNSKQLEEGRILYSPSFGDLDFRLEIATNDHRTQAESIAVLGWDGKPPAEPPAISTPEAARVSGAQTKAVPRLVANAETRPKATGGAAQKAAQTPNTDKDPVEPRARDMEPRIPPVVNAALNESGSKPANTPEPVKALPEPVKAPPEAVKAPPEPAKVPVETARIADRSEPNSEPRSPESSRPAAARPSAPLPSSSAPQPSLSTQSRDQIASAPPAREAPAPAPTNTNVAGPASVPRITERVLGSSLVSPIPILKSNPTVTPEVGELLKKSGPKGEFVVSVRVSIDTSGNVKDAEVISWNGGTQVASFPFKSAAVRAARLWKFRPGMLNGSVVPSEYTIQFQFK